MLRDIDLPGTPETYLTTTFCACIMGAINCNFSQRPGGGHMCKLMQRLWREDAGQDIAEYAVMLAVILVLVVGTVRLIGSNANTAFSSVASSIQ
jgi:Flp pilus assembly pilin Flp